MRKLLAVVLTGAALAAPTAVRAQDVVLDWNTGATGAGYWGFQEVGWFFTPQEDIWVSFLGTKFGSYGSDRLVTAEIRTAPGADGGVTLASGTFNSSTARTGIGGATFDTSLLLQAGNMYFLGFRNVQLLGANATTLPGSDGPADLRFGYTTSGLYSYLTSSSYRPILALLGSFDTSTEEEEVGEEEQPEIPDDLPTSFDEIDETTQGDVVTPEPITMILLGTGLAGVGALRRRRREGEIES